jgi:hypothetical protein
MKMYGETEVKSHALMSALEGGKRSPSSSGRLSQTTKASLDRNSEEKHRIPGCPARSHWLY